MDSVNYTTLTYISCLLLDFPENRTLCSEENPNNCVRCPERAEFFFGGDINETKSFGHKVCVLIWVLTLIIGFLGAFTNCFIIAVFSRHKGKKMFEVMLIVLAIFDLICCVMSALSATGIITYFENWNRGSFTLHWIYLSFYTALSGRTGSTFATMVTATERIIFLAYPEKAGPWLSGTRGKIAALSVLILAVLINIPRYSSFKVDENNFANISNLSELKYIIQPIPTMEKFWYEKLHAVHNHLDFWAPFPILLVLFVLAQWQIRKISKIKKELQVTRKKDVRAVQMFCAVILVFFVSSVLPITHYTFIHASKIIHREQALAMGMCIAVNSLANLPIYYTRSSVFRKEARAVVFEWIHRRNSLRTSVQAL